MASTLDGATTRDRMLGKGHGAGALGPSDTSDTGSDVTGGPGLIEGDVIGLDQGTNEDPERSAGATAGSTIGDTDLDSDTDSVGTGERKTVGREPAGRANSDRLTDRIERVPERGCRAAVSPRDSEAIRVAARPGATAWRGGGSGANTPDKGPDAFTAETVHTHKRAAYLML
jgi:hypothetical protein